MPRGEGRPRKPLNLTDDEKFHLEAQVRRHRLPKSASDRYRLILRCADGLRNTEVAAELGRSVETVGKWRQRFVEGRFDGLEDSPRSGRSRTSTDDEIQAILAQPLHGNPKGGNPRVPADDDRSVEPVAYPHLAHLGSLWPPATPVGNLQALDRPACC